MMLRSGPPFIPFARFVVLCALVAMTRSPLLLAQPANVLTVIHADSLVGRMVENTEFRELVGNVKLRQDDVVITCDKAVQNLTHNSAQLIGNVVVTQDTLTLKAMSGDYDGNTKTASSDRPLMLNDRHVTLKAKRGRYDTRAKIAWFSSDVSVEDSLVTILAQELVYERDSSKATAVRDVVLLGKTENMTVTGDSAIHFHKRNVSILPARPVLWQVDTTVVRRDSLTAAPDSIRLDTLYLRALRMEAHRDSTNRFLAEGDVEIVRGELAARCGNARFLRSDSLVILRQQPIVWYDRTQITGDSIAALLENNELREVVVTGAAFTATESRPTEKDSIGPPNRYDQMKGALLHLWVRDRKARRIRVEQSAISLYYLYEDRALNGVRRESGDLILIDFLDGKLDTIHAVGNIEGSMFPEKFVTNRETGYNLDGFFIHPNRPVLPSR